MTYVHTQRGPRLVLLNLLMASFAVRLLVKTSVPGVPTGVRLTLYVVLFVLLATAVTFSSFTISAGDGRLAWWFGPHMLRKEVALASIVAAEPMTTSVVNGWGIHLTSRGWLYNVAGRQAVLVTLHEGKQFLLGTDEPLRLAGALLPNASTPR
jgi:hypothetical protein